MRMELDFVCSLDFNSEGTRLATAYYIGALEVRNVDTNEVMMSQTLHMNVFGNVIFQHQWKQ